MRKIRRHINCKDQWFNLSSEMVREEYVKLQKGS